MSITFLSKHATPRRLGAGVGVAVRFGLVGLAVLAPSGRGATSLLALAILSTALSLPLGWLFAPRALAPGIGSALGAALGVTALAVPLGACAVGLVMALGADGLSPSGMLGGLVFVVLAGLILFGIPLGCLTFAVAGVWVILVRALAPVLGVEASPNPWR